MKNYECYNELAYWDKFLSEKRLATVGFCENNTQETVIVNADFQQSMAVPAELLCRAWLFAVCVFAYSFLSYHVWK